MMHTAWCSIEELPYHCSRSPIKFQDHRGWKSYDLNPIWVRLLGRSQLSNPSDLPCFEDGYMKHLREWTIEWKVRGRTNWCDYIICIICVSTRPSAKICYYSIQIASLISALPSNWFGLLCFKSGNIEQGTKETWIAEMKAWYVYHRLTN